VSRRRAGGALIAALAVAGALALAGCTSSDGVAGYTSGQGYVSSDGVYLEIKPADRQDAVSFSGPTVDGTTFDSSSVRGKVTVVNFWYAGCAPCRVEAPILASLSSELDDVRFVGVNTYDDADVARTFDEKNGIGYPSILDVKSGAVQLAFAGFVPPNAVPTTLVLDTEGRVAYRVSGLIQDAKILRDIVETVEQEG